MADTEWTEVGPLGSQRDSEEKPTGSPRAVTHLTHPAVPQSWCGQDGPASNDIADVICPSCLRALIRHLTRNEDAKAQPAAPPLQPDPDLITHTEGARHAERAKAAARAALGATRADPQGLANGKVTVYDGEGGWSAVYLDGKLQRVGDSYLADEWVREHFGVETVQSDDFLRGGTSRADVAPTLDDLRDYADEQAARQARAKALRDEAARLLAEADAEAAR